MTDWKTTVFCCLLDMQRFMVGGQTEKTYIVFTNVAYKIFLSWLSTN